MENYHRKFSILNKLFKTLANSFNLKDFLLLSKYIKMNNWIHVISFGVYYQAEMGIIPILLGLLLITSMPQYFCSGLNGVPPEFMSTQSLRILYYLEMGSLQL